MKEFKGTKGKWAIVHSRTNPAFNIVGTTLGGRHKIARVPYPIDINESSELNEKEKLEAEYNAKLIATAPELLDSLTKLVNSWVSAGEALHILLQEQSYINAKEVLNKALGL
jgi:hypothetical protein